MSSLEGEITIPSKVFFNNEEWTVTAIGSDSFAWSKITKIFIPETVTKIGSHAFVKCYDLREISIPNSVISISSAAFQECTNLPNVVLPQNLIEIPSYCFLDCYALSEIDIPSTVQSIGGYAFGYCTSLKKVFINNYCTIYSLAFENSNSITDIYVNSSTPPYCSDTKVFQGIVYMKATLHVPIGAISIYSDKNPWSEFETINEYDFAGLNYIISENSDKYPRYFIDFNGRRRNTPHVGFNIIIWSDGSSSKIYIH